MHCNPQAGNEQVGHRPDLVPSPAGYDHAGRLMLCCPINSQKKDYPFEVVIPDDPDHKSVVLGDQVKSLDWKVREPV